MTFLRDIRKRALHFFLQSVMTICPWQCRSKQNYKYAALRAYSRVSHLVSVIPMASNFLKSSLWKISSREVYLHVTYLRRHAGVGEITDTWNLSTYVTGRSGSVPQMFCYLKLWAGAATGMDWPVDYHQMHYLFVQLGTWCYKKIFKKLLTFNNKIGNDSMKRNIQYLKYCVLMSYSTGPVYVYLQAKCIYV